MSIDTFCNDIKTKQKTIYIDSLKSFLEIINQLIMDKNFIFRGISKYNERYPKIIRDEREYSFEREVRLLNIFERYYGLYNKVRDCWEFVSLAQHHGLETRLIDFSNNPFVAAFFSLYNPSSSEYVIYVGDKRTFNDAKKFDYQVFGESFFGNLSELTLSAKVEHNFTILEGKKEIVFLEPNYGNNRVFAQQGLFIIPPFVDAKFIDGIYDDMPFKLVIDKNAREDILDYLSKSNFDEYHLMPDLSSACFEINKTTK